MDVEDSPDFANGQIDGILDDVSGSDFLTLSLVLSVLRQSRFLSRGIEFLRLLKRSILSSLGSVLELNVE